MFLNDCKSEIRLRERCERARVGLVVRIFVVVKVKAIVYCASPMKCITINVVKDVWFLISA